MNGIREWLSLLGMEQYAGAFEANDVDSEVLPALTEQDLRDLGVASLGHRRKLLTAIASLRTDPTGEQTNRSSRALPKPTELPTAERRQLTVLFCDMVGFTDLASRLDPEVLEGIIRAYEDVCAGCVTRYEGFVFQRLGDGIVAFFGYPLAHEGEAERAIHSGMEIIAALSKLDIPDAGHLQVRIGIASGLVVVSSAEKGAVGDTMNLASRLQGIARPDGIVVSERVHRLAGGAFEYEDLGQRTLKGIARPTHVYRVVGAGAAASRFEASTQEALTPLVGREQEIGLLLERWRVSQDGEGQVVLLSGEPGIGKSRVLSALCRRLEQSGARTLRFQCSPYYVNSAFYPYISYFERALHFGRDEAPDGKLDKLEGLIGEHFGRPGADVRFIASMLSIPTEARYGALAMTPEKHKDETLRALVDLTEAAARKQSSVMLFEDAHWSDPTTLEVLDRLIDRVKSFPLLIVLTHRPEFQPRWSQHGHVTALNLSKLTRTQTGTIVSKLAKGKALPPDVLEQMLGKTDGVPLFIEELTKSVLESGYLTDMGDRYESSGSPASISIPTTLRDSLTARLDRFAPIKEIAQIGAAIGREFGYELIAAVAPMNEAALGIALEQLTDSGLAFRRGTPPDASYIFKHALVQEAAYDMLLLSRRRELHGQIARALETRFPEAVSTDPELLAQHFAEAGLADAAIAYRLKASRRSIGRSAYREALAHVSAGNEQLQRLPEGHERSALELQLQLLRGTALQATKGMSAPETGAAFAAARELSKQLGRDVKEVLPGLFGVYIFHIARGEHHSALEVAKEALQQAQQVDEPALWVIAHRMMGVPLHFLGELSEAVEHLEQAVRLYDFERDRESALVYGSDSKAASLSILSQSLFALGQPDRALAVARRAVDHAQAMMHIHSIAHALAQLCGVLLLRREPELALEQAKRAMDLSQQHALGMQHEVAKALVGAALVDLHEASEGMALLRESLRDSEQMGLRITRASKLRRLAAGAAEMKQWDEAANYLDEALDEVGVSGERWYEAELRRCKGEFLLERGGVAATAQAEACFVESLGIARSQDAKAWELRTSTSLARLWQQQGKIEEARDLLACVYGWFTEGFDTRDLQEAKALLSELA